MPLQIRTPVILSVAALLFAVPVSAQTSAPVAPRIGGYLQVRESGQQKQGLSFVLNRARLSLDSPLPNKFSTRFLVEYEAGAGVRNPAIVSLREAIIRWAPNSFSVTAGQFKTPFSREYLIPVPQLETADFSPVVDSLAPKYDVGVMGEWSPAPWGNVQLGVFNGEGQNSIANRDSVALWVARVVARPLAPVSVGAALARDSADSLRWGVETELQQWGGVLRGEYILKHRRARAHELDDRGWYVFGAARVTPTVQCFARHGDFQRPSVGTARRARESSVGVNVECVPNRVRLLFTGVRRTSGAKQTDARSYIAQLQVRF